MAGLVTGAIGLAAMVAYHADERFIYDGLTGDALPLVIVSGLCGLAVLTLLWRGVHRGLRPLAVGALVAMIWGWGVAQWPYLLPKSLTINAGAGAHSTLSPCWLCSSSR